MRRRDQWIEWIRAVERECEVVAVALQLLDERLRRDPSSLKDLALGTRDFVDVKQNREATYVVRIFAEFENALREAWREAYRRSSHPSTGDLLDGCARRCRMPIDRLADAHRVRIYRNSIVHDESRPAKPASIAEARRFLCRFLGHLPPELVTELSPGLLGAWRRWPAPGECGSFPGRSA